MKTNIIVSLIIIALIILTIISIVKLNKVNKSSAVVNTNTNTNTTTSFKQGGQINTSTPQLSENVNAQVLLNAVKDNMRKNLVNEMDIKFYKK